MQFSPQQKHLAKRMTKGLFFASYLAGNLPVGWIAGLRLREIDEDKCVTSVPFNFLTKNPFKSIYFAVQSMAAELSTAVACLIAVQGREPSVAFIIVDMKAVFTKKAAGRAYFTCEDNRKALAAVEKCIETGEAETVAFKTTGKLADGTIVSEFEFTWSFRQRKS